MATFTNEPFTAANGTDVDSLTGWDEHPLRTAGQFLVQANRAYAAAADSIVYHSGTPASADYSVSATIYVASLAASTRTGPLGRMDTTVETYYELVYLTTGTRWRLSRVVNGTLLEIGSYTQALTPTSSYVAKLEMIGSTVNAYIDGTLRIAVDDSVAPILAKGKAGIKGGGPAVTTTTGLHFDTLSATDASAPADTISYVAAGTFAVAGSGNITPGLPAGVVTDDQQVLFAYSKSGATITIPAGWTTVVNGGTTQQKLAIATRPYVTGDSAPVVNGSGEIAAQVAAFRDVDKTTPVDVLGSAAGTNSVVADIGPITGITPSVSGATVIVAGGRTNDWTSVAALTGDSQTWNEIGEPDDATRSVGLVWDYAIISGAPVAITAKTFTVTTGGQNGAWRGVMLALRPSTTVAAPVTNPTKVKIAGVFVTKVMKRKAAGVFATKPTKPLSTHPPPPPPPPTDPVPYTLPAVSSTNAAMPLTYTVAPPNYFIFPAAEADAAEPLTYLQHPPPPDSGMKMMMWIGDQNIAAASAADLNYVRGLGFDGFHISIGHMANMGNSAAAYTANLQWCMDFADAHPEFDCRIAPYLVNYIKNWSPGAPWYDDATWDNTVFPNIAQAATAVRDSALNGISFDGEPYKTTWGVAGREGWNFAVLTGQPGGTTEQDMRDKTYERAVEVATTITNITSPAKIAQYHLYLPNSYREYIFRDTPPAPIYQHYSTPEWLDGISSVSGVTFRVEDAAFYKEVQDSGTTAPKVTSWDQAYNINITGWEGTVGGARSNTYLSGFIWITPGPNARQQQAAGKPIIAQDRQHTVAEVTLQLQKARQYAQGNEFAVYDQGYIAPPTAYAPVAAALQSASA